MREQVDAKNMKISFIKGEDQLADILTNPLATDCFQRLKFNLNVVPPIEIEGGGVSRICRTECQLTA